MCRVTGRNGDGRCESPGFLFRQYYALPGVFRWLEHAGKHAGVCVELRVGRETGDARARDFVSTILFGFQRIRKQKVDFLTGDKNMSRVFCNDDLRHCTADA